MIDAPAEPDPPEIGHILRGFWGVLAFDIGANVGQSARLMGARFDRVISCEPAAESFEILEAADLPVGVVRLPVAVSRKSGTVLLTEQDRHLSRGQLTSFAGEDVDGHAWGKVMGHRTVTAVTLDDLTAEYGVPDFIKCDVEGHEVEVFRGGPKTLLGTPRLYVEVHEASLGRELERLLLPLYGTRLRAVLHPHYPPGSWGRDNHYWLVAD